MAVSGCGIIFKYILIHLCVIFEVVGSVFLGYGVWWKKENAEVHEKSVLLATFVWIVMVQGAMMIIMGVCGIYCVWKLKTIGLKVLSVLLAIFALADIVVGMVVHFSCEQKCSKLLPQILSDKASDKVMGFFLGTAALLIFTLICTTVFLKQNSEDYFKLFWCCVQKGLII